jgi:peroxiredoxin Q/BCP
MLEWLFSDPLPVGTPAPGFTLPDQDGNPVSLESMRGKNVVLVFYPLDDSMVCTIQLGEFRDEWEDVKKHNAVVFGLNSDPGARHLSFKEKQRLPFPLLVDEGQKVARLYNANRPVVVKRTVYLIGPDGVIRYAKRGKPSPQEVLAAAV